MSRLGNTWVDGRVGEMLGRVLLVQETGEGGAMLGYVRVVEEVTADYGARGRYDTPKL